MVRNLRKFILAHSTKRNKLAWFNKARSPKILYSVAGAETPNTCRLIILIRRYTTRVWTFWKYVAFIWIMNWYHCGCLLSFCKKKSDVCVCVWERGRERGRGLFHIRTTEEYNKLSLIFFIFHFCSCTRLANVSRVCYPIIMLIIFCGTKNQFSSWCPPMMYCRTLFPVQRG